MFGVDEWLRQMAEGRTRGGARHRIRARAETLAVGTALSMAALSYALGRVLTGPRRFDLTPAMGVLTSVFGTWYVLAAL